MKKMILAALVAVCSLSANAQVWIGGQVGFATANYDNAIDILDVEGDKSVTTFNITPEIGYTLNDKWDIAMQIGYNYSKVEDCDALGAFTVAPYARYTFANSGKVGFFLDMGFGIQTGDFYSNALGKAYEDETAWHVGVRPGIKFAASDKVTLVATTGFLGYQAAGDDDAFGFNVNGNNLQIGAYYSF